MRVIGFDPAGNSFGMAGVEFDGEELNLFLSYELKSPNPDWKMNQKNIFVTHLAATIAMLEKPDYFVSEAPFGMGHSAQSLKEAIGMLKTELMNNIVWYGVSEARMAVLGEGNGGAKKDQTAEWIMEYPWTRSSKTKLKKMIELANPETKEGYDVLDAVLHILCFLIKEKGLLPLAKPVKVKKSKKKEA